MRIQVVVEELEVEVASMGQDEDRGVPDQLVGLDPDRGTHTAVGPLLGTRDVSVREQSTQRRAILPVQSDVA